MNLEEIWDALFGGVADYAAILGLVANSIIAGAVVGLVGGLIGVFVIQRDMAFAVHGISSLTQAPDFPCCANLKIEGVTGNEACPEVIPVMRCPIRTEAGRSIP